MKNTRIKVGILSMGLLAMAQLALTTIIQPISQSFPNVPVSVIQMLGSLPSIGGILAALLISPLSMHISNRWLALDGIIMVCLGGLTPIILHTSITILLVCAGLLGIGQSFITTMIPTLLSEYTNDEERQKLLGVYQAVSSFGALIITMAAGVLATHAWSNTYYIYLLSLLVLVIATICLPNDTSKSPIESNNHKSIIQNESLKLPKQVYTLGLISFCLTMIYTAFANNIGIFLGTSQLGNAATTGLVIAIGTIGGLLTGLSLGKIFPLLGNNALLIAFLLTGLPFIVIFFVRSLPIIFIASLFSGSGMVVYQVRGAFLMSSQNIPILIPKAMAIFTLGNSLGGLASPLVFRALGFQAGISSLLAAGILSIVIATVLGISRFEHKVAPAKVVSEANNHEKNK